MKSKSKEVTRIGTIASQCNKGGTHVIVSHSWEGLRVFCITKDDYDCMRRQEEKGRVKAVGNFASALLDGASVSLGGRE